MRRSRTFILFAVVLLLVAVALFLWLNRPAPPPKTAEPTAQAVPMTKIVVAFQNIPRGGQIITGAVGLFDWPTTQAPPSALKEADLNKVIGQFAKIDIPQGLPVLPSMVAIQSSGSRRRRWALLRPWPSRPARSASRSPSAPRTRKRRTCPTTGATRRSCPASSVWPMRCNPATVWTCWPASGCMRWTRTFSPGCRTRSGTLILRIQASR